MDVRRTALLAVLLLAAAALAVWDRQEEAATPPEPVERAAARQEAAAATPPEPVERAADRQEGAATPPEPAPVAAARHEAPAFSPHSPGIAADRAALAALYQATGGDGWDVNTNWLSPTSLNAWYGVTTGPDGRVTQLSSRTGRDGPPRRSPRRPGTWPARSRRRSAT